MTVTLKNKTGRAKVIVLDHAAFRTREYGFRRTTQTVVDQGKDGTRTPRTVRRDLSGVITLPPHGSVSGLHPAIVNCAQVRTMLAYTPPELEVVKDAEPVVEKAQARKGAK